MRNYYENKYIYGQNTLELIEPNIYRVLVSPEFAYGSFVLFSNGKLTQC